MSRGFWLVPVVGLVLGSGVFISPILQAGLDQDRQQQLRYLLKHDCGSCHGMTLKGGLGPSLRPEALNGKTDELLLRAILDGRPGTPMPPWKHLLTEEEARWLVTLMRNGGVR